MEWESYINEVLSQDDALDELYVSTDGGDTYEQFPPVIKASVRILDSILEDGGKRNLFVFPEKQQMLFLFMLAKVIHNLTDGKISHNYDPSQFTAGQKVKLGDAVAEYLRAAEIDGKKGVWLKFSNMTGYFCPNELLPVMQRVKTKKPISKYETFSQERKRINELMATFGSDSVLLNLVSHKSHLDKSIVYVSSVSVAKARLGECLLDNRKIQDILLLGQTNFDGEIKNISAGQLDGNPALILASDLYAANNAAAMGNPLQSMIIDITNIHQINEHLDSMDGAISLKIPLLCITDAADAFELAELKKRGFRIWRWDSVSLTEDLMSGETFLDKRLKNCSNHSIHYNNITDPTLSECMMRLSRQKHAVADQTSDVIRLYDLLTDLTFRALRETKRFGFRQTEEAGRVFNFCAGLKLAESPFVPDDLAQDLNTAASVLRDVYSNQKPQPKGQAMREWFTENANGRKICIVVPENENRQSGMVISGNTLLDYVGKDSTVFIPQGIQVISSCAFECNEIIRNITIPDSVKMIGPAAFRGCSRLMEVSIPKGVEEIYRFTFSNCIMLSHIDIPDSVIEIGENAFTGCSLLDIIDIPKSVKTVSANAFSDQWSPASNLTIVVRNPDLVLHKKCLEGCKDFTIYAPEGSLVSKFSPSRTKSLQEYNEKK